MTEHDPIKLGFEFYTPTIQEIFDAYLALSDEEKSPIQERASRLRAEPNGMNEREAILGAMVEKMTADLEIYEAQKF